MVKEKMISFKTDKTFIISGYIYIKMTIRLILKGQDFTVC